MNYERTYRALIAMRMTTPADGYTERHHIIPKCRGGSDDHDNIVRLTAREHFIAHALLARMHGGVLWLAVIRMKGRRFGDGYVNSRLYEMARVEWAAWSSANQCGENHWAFGKPSPLRGVKRPEFSGPNHPRFGQKMSPEQTAALALANTGAKRSSETKRRISESQQGDKNHRFGKALSAEQKAALSVKNKGRKISAEHLAKNIANRTGKKHSEETKAAYSAARKGRPAHPNSIAAVIASNKRRAALK